MPGRVAASVLPATAVGGSVVRWADAFGVVGVARGCGTVTVAIGGSAGVVGWSAGVVGWSAGVVGWSAGVVGWSAGVVGWSAALPCVRADGCAEAGSGLAHLLSLGQRLVDRASSVGALVALAAVGSDRLVRLVTGGNLRVADVAVGALGFRGDLDRFFLGIHGLDGV